MTARILVLVAFVACHPNKPTIPTWSPPTSGAYRSTDAFHVAVADAHATWDNMPSFWPCPLDGATFLCGTGRVLAIRGDRVEPDPALERGRTPGIVETIVGRWPDDAWLVTRTPMGPNVSCGSCHYSVHRWRGDRWERVAELTDWYPGSAVAWYGALFIVRNYPRRVLAVIAADASPLARRIVADSRCALMPGIVATSTTFFVVGSNCKVAPSQDVTRWTETGPAVERPISLPPVSHTQLLDTVATPHGPAIFGSYAEYADRDDGSVETDEKAVAIRFEDGRWISRDPPGHVVRSYAGAPDGTEWALVNDDDVTTSGLFVREAGGAWQPADDRWQVEALRYGASPYVGKLWIAEGSVWLWVEVEDSCGPGGCENKSLLLRTGASAPAVMIERDRGI
jgi:hypothetical protein